MATGVQVAWSVTANSNDIADTNINWAEGQAPSTVNNSSRAEMAAVKRFAKDMQGGLLAAGTSTAYTLTTNEVLGALSDGLTVTCRMPATNGAAPTLNVDSLGAVAIQSAVGTAVETGALLSGAIYKFTYYAASAAWLVNGLVSRAVSNALVYRPFAAGNKQLFFTTAAPTGWIKDTSLNNGTVRMVSGAVGADGGTADFTAALSSRTIAQANLPNVSFPVTDPGHKHVYTKAPGGFAGTADFPSSYRAGSEANADTTTVLTGISVSSGGSGTAMDFAVKYADGIRAEIQ